MVAPTIVKAWKMYWHGCSYPIKRNYEKNPSTCLLNNRANLARFVNQQVEKGSQYFNFIDYHIFFNFDRLGNA